jgi:S1-C subfamily serine protease
MRFGDGLTIDVVTPGTAADTAGLAAGDKIIKVGDKAVSEPRELFQEIAELTGDIKLTVLRESKEVAVKLALPERP